MGKVKIVGGEHRSRIIEFNDGIDGLRPTPNRVRETLFNWLGQELYGYRVLDAFSGSGVLGFESSSRGAKEVTMLDNNRVNIKQLNQEKSKLKLTNCQIIHIDSISYLKNCKIQFNVIFLDPPYSSDLLQKSLDIIIEKKLLADNGYIYIEYDNITPEIDKFSVYREGHAGAVKYKLLQILELE